MMARPGQRHAAAGQRAREQLRQLKAKEFAAMQARAIDGMHSALLSVQIEVYALQDGEHCTGALAHIGWVLAAGAMTALNSTNDPKDVSLRRMHGALRSVHAMCLAGYRWRAELAPAIDAAAAEAHALMLKHPEVAQRSTSSADHYAALIRTQKVKPEHVKGSEVYAELAAGVPEEVAG